MSAEPRDKLYGIPHPFSVKVDGRDWHLFDAEYVTPDGKFCFYFYAISPEHAEHILEDVKANARVTGQCIEAYKA